MSEFETRDEMREELDRAHAFPRTIEGLRHRRSILRAAATAPHYARHATRTVAALVTEELDSRDSVAGKQAGKAQLSQGIQENGLKTLAEIGKDTPGYLCDPAVISTLLSSVVTAVSTDGRVNAAAALQGVIEHDLESVVELGSPDQLVAGLFDTDIRVSHRVARLLQQWLEQQRYNENQRAVDHVVALCAGQVENEIADALEPVLHRKPAIALGTHRILRAVCRTDDWEARRAGVYMLGTALQVAPATIDRELTTELFARVDDSDYRVRLVAVYHLSVASTRDPQVASEALTVCSTALVDTHHRVRAEAAEQIGTIATNCETVPGKTIADIERALVNGEPNVQRDAALGLGTLLGETAINEAPHAELLIDNLPDASTKAQAGIARGLARIAARDPDAGEMISYHLLDKIEAGETTVDGLPTAIGAVASDSEEEIQRRIYRRLSELVENGTTPQRVTATRAFVSLSEWHGLHHPEILFNRFLSLLDDSNVDIQQAAAAGLQSVSMDAISPSRNNSDRLEGHLQAESWSVRFAAAAQLVAHNPKSVSTPDQVLSALLDGLHQGSLKTRLTAVQRVGDICHHYPPCRTEGIEKLAGHLKMVDSLVQRDILDVLAGLTNLEPESVRVVTESVINSYRSNPQETSQPLGELLARLYVEELLSPGKKHLQETIPSLITDHSVDEPWETILVDMLVQIPTKTSVHDLN